MAAQQVAAPRGRAIPLVSSLVAVALTLLVIAWSILFSNPGGILLAAVYALPGLVLALRRPGQPIAWLLLLLGLAFALGTTVTTASLDALLAGEADAIGQLTAWAGTTGWVLFFAGFLGIQLTFPAGTFAEGRWRAVSFALIAAYMVIGGLMIFGPTIPVDVPGQPFSIQVANPFGLPLLAEVNEGTPGAALLFPVLLVGQVVALLVMLARFRRSTGLERLQYRWLGSAAAVVVLGTVAWALVTQVLETEFALLPGIVIGLTWPWLPISIVVAVLRYRLYEIDRLVSRTVGWVLATAAVLGIFVLGVLGFQALLSGVTRDQGLAVAASTLLAAALFQPLRARLQAMVDRRFDRPRIEAERTLAAYGERLRHEVDLDMIRLGVVDTVAVTLRPAAAGVWIRGRTAQSES
jgi:hypothetical protein